MFTGIVEAAGKIVAVSPVRLEVASDLEDLALGESISVNGVCLTVASRSGGDFAADISE